MEDFRKDEEEFAPGGWQMCCLFAQARLMQNSKVGDDSAQGVEKLLTRVNFAANSEYKVTGQSRTVEDGLRVYDRVMAAKAADILLESRVTLGVKSPLDSFSKLVIVSQKAPPSPHNPRPYLSA
jgi:hypothetical protein